jgi:hypothetical protein
MDLKGLPKEVVAKLMSFTTETDGGVEVRDSDGFIRFVTEHCEQYPVLLDLVTVNEKALIDHFEKTGEVPPGIKLIGTAREAPNVTRLTILHGPIPPSKR